MIQTLMSTVLGASVDGVHLVDFVNFAPENEIEIAFYHFWLRRQIWKVLKSTEKQLPRQVLAATLF